MVRSLCALGLAVLLFTALAPSRLLQELWQPCSHCVLIDAGSSGTRVRTAGVDATIEMNLVYSSSMRSSSPA